jgi:hypothetical protein
MRPQSPADYTLAALVLAGVCLRAFAALAWWPTMPTFADSWPYAYYAAHGVFGDPQHPAGYSLFLWTIGLVTRQVAVTTILQHFIGIGTALVLFTAVRRLVGSPWPALLPAAIVLLNADQVYQEQLVASEPLSAALLASAAYATVRAIDSVPNARRWAAGAGALAAAATIVRTEVIFLAPVLAFALLIGHKPRRRRWTASAVLVCVWGVLLIGYGAVKDIATGRFEVGPSTGWQLYGRAATFADCHLFTPPRGTAGLCESTPPVNRFGHDHYMYDPSSPAVRLFGHIGNDDGKLQAWAIDAIEAEPSVYLSSVYHNLRDYFIPSLFVYVPGAGSGLDGELDWGSIPDPTTTRNVTVGMESFFDRFNAHRHPRRVRALRDYQRIFRFGATMLTLTALLALLGLGIGSRNARVGVIIFGLGGIVTLFPEALVGAYLGRYTVPLAGPMAAAAGISLWSVAQMERIRREHGPPGPGPAAAPAKALTSPGDDQTAAPDRRPPTSQTPTSAG